MVIEVSKEFWFDVWCFDILVRQDDEDVESVEYFIGVICMHSLNFR